MLAQTTRGAIQTYLVLRRTLLHGPDTGALSLAVHGRRMQDDSVHEIFTRLNAQAGADARHLHPHLLRHSIGVHLLRRGAEIRHFQAFLGHANLNTTKIDLCLVPGHLAKDFEKGHAGDRDRAVGGGAA